MVGPVLTKKKKRNTEGINCCAGDCRVSISMVQSDGDACEVCMRWRDLIGGRGTVRGHPNGRFNHRTIKRDEWLKRQRAGVAVSLILFLFHCNDPSKLIYRPGFVSVTFPRVRG